MIIAVQQEKVNDQRTMSMEVSDGNWHGMQMLKRCAHQNSSLASG
jgi:hypothetical protein